MPYNITYHPVSPLKINVKLDNKIVGAIHTKRNDNGYCYVPKGQSWSKGLWERHETLADCKKVIEAE